MLNFISQGVTQKIHFRFEREKGTDLFGFENYHKDILDRIAEMRHRKKDVFYFYYYLDLFVQVTVLMFNGKTDGRRWWRGNWNLCLFFR